jgi:hypothetical protein
VTIHIPLWLLIAFIPMALLLIFEQIWVRYLAVMHLKQVMGAQGLKPASRFFGFYMVLPIGVVLDWLGNLLATFVFWGLPDQPWELITGRLQRYEDGPDGWRRHWAWAFAEDMLNPFDQPEGHIKRRETDK